MATEKRLIDANAFRDYWNKNYRHQYANDTFLFAIANFPTVDAVEVVRCKDCKSKFEYSPNHLFCYLTGLPIDEDDFCSCGERKDNG